MKKIIFASLCMAAMSSGVVFAEPDLCPPLRLQVVNWTNVDIKPKSFWLTQSTGESGATLYSDAIVAGGYADAEFKPVPRIKDTGRFVIQLHGYDSPFGSGAPVCNYLNIPTKDGCAPDTVRGLLYTINQVSAGITCTITTY